MKAKELFKKLEAYNEVSELMDDEYRLQLCFNLVNELKVRKYMSYKAFARDITEEFIKEVAEAIINHDYVINDWNMVEAKRYDYKFVESIEVYYSKTREF